MALTFDGKHYEPLFVWRAEQSAGIGFENLVSFVPSGPFLPFPLRRSTSVRRLSVPRFRLRQDRFGEVRNHGADQPVRENGI